MGLELDFFSMATTAHFTQLNSLHSDCSCAELLGRKPDQNTGEKKGMLQPEGSFGQAHAGGGGGGTGKGAYQ